MSKARLGSVASIIAGVVIGAGAVMLGVRYRCRPCGLGLLGIFT